MENKFKLGFIGAGNMATAILQGILSSGIIPNNKIVVSDISDAKKDYFASLGITFTNDNKYVASNCDYLLFAVKPQIAPYVFECIKNNLSCQTVISIMAGVSIEKLQKALGTSVNFARIMPNMPATVGEGMSAITFSKQNDDFVIDIFKSVGKVVELDECLFDAVTSLSGSGPAYVYMFIDALIQGGIEGGLNKDDATTLALQTVIGAVKMIEQSNKPIDEMVDAVCSKGGTTIQAVEHYRNNNLKKIVVDGMTKCRQRSEELGK